VRSERPWSEEALKERRHYLELHLHGMKRQQSCHGRVNGPKKADTRSAQGCQNLLHKTNFGVEKEVSFSIKVHFS
jgi:hypothetical protein